MIATIIKVTEKDSKYNTKGMYYDVLFRTEATGGYYRSCIFPDCNNFNRWKGKLIVGNTFSNLNMIDIKGKPFIDADSNPVLIEKKVKVENKKIKTKQEKLF
jgi:hypothetical protein